MTVICCTTCHGYSKVVHSLDNASKLSNLCFFYDSVIIYQNQTVYNGLKSFASEHFSDHDLHIVGKCPFCGEFNRDQRIDERQKLISTLRARKLRYFLDLIRLNNVYRTLLEGYIDGARGRGRPRMSWYDNIKEWTSLRNLRYEQATRIAMDRERWRATVSSNVKR